MLLDQRSLEDDGHPDHIDRPRLQSRLAGPAAASIAVLVGPAGSGKGELVRALRSDARTVYFRVGNGRGTFGRFVHGLAQAIVHVAPGAQASFPRAWERALQSRSPTTVLAHWLCEHLNEIDCRIVIDDLHDAAADLSIASFIGKVAELRPNAQLTIAARSVGALPIALWMATRRMERPIDETDLRFNRAEVVDAAERFGVVLESRAVDALRGATGGSPIAVAYALTRLRYNAYEFVTAIMPAAFEDIAQSIFARRTGDEREFLFSASLFPSVDDGLLGRSGWDDARSIRVAIGSDAAFMWQGDTQGGFRFHDRFRDYLMQQFRSRDFEFRSTMAHRTVHSLRAAGHYAGALQVATDQRLIGAMGELLDAHGFEILESGEIDVISEALAALHDAEQSLGAQALALRGYMEARSGHLDTAEAWFRLGLAKAQDETSRVAIAMYYARELARRRREDSCEVLAAFADSTTLPRSILIDVRSSFGQALAAANRLDEACSRTNEALALLESDSPPALRARVFARAAYVANESGYPMLARERARIAAPLAVAQSLYDVAASTYSVLYNVAYDFDDDAASALEYLRRMRDLGVKAGTLRFDLYALLGMYELHAEAGDGEALRELDRQLSGTDKHDATVEIMESLLPVKALQAGWNGDFDDAQRLLRPTAEHQATSARRALTWAQIGLYCAATSDTERADEAFRQAQDALKHSDAGTTQFGLALLTLALGALVSGNIEGVRKWTRSADDATIGPAPRLRALRGAIEAMIASWSDLDRFAQDVPSALANLWAVSFGGMAKLIEALPHRFTQTTHGTETIGSVLARQELSARFAAAVASGNATALRAWLDSVSGSTFGVSIPERFEQWAARLGHSDRRTQTAIHTVQREVAAYRRPARSIARRVDDIDVSIGDLFVHLDVAAPLMAEHSRAVSAWCSRLGRILGLSEREIAFVTRCGLIHDIGKMRTPTEILEAPRQLSPDEWAIMRDHAAEGGRIVERLPLLAAFVPIVRGHHERLDGRGYPDGLRSSSIPLAARIVSVADSFNAMIGRRPYRPPLAPTEALDELERHRGTQFDPEIVEAMVRIVLGQLAEPDASKTASKRPP